MILSLSVLNIFLRNFILNKVCLVVLYKNVNHNLFDKIEEFYKGRFEKIFHLVPWYKGNRENVINVYENKFQKNGYLAQARFDLLKEDFTHFVIIDEDVCLNNDINSYNIIEKFNLDDESAFISDNIFAVNEMTMYETKWAFPSIYNFWLSKNGAQIKEYLPKKAEARAIFKKFGIKTPFIYTDYMRFLQEHLIIGGKQTHEFYRELERGKMNIKTLTSAFTSKLEQDKKVTIYPFVASNAKMFIVPKKTFEDFIYYAGMFSAIRVHYNIGFAMSLCYSQEKIVMEKDLNSDNKILNLDKNNDGTILMELIKENKGNINTFIMFYPVNFTEWTEEI